ncbi:glycosyltransferase family 2 protein [uncultured Streptococcus sp.]|uniref:glycosyltransferase family 2 protein n=1 Tax=uncultured Streptococcus sp. TaxID=83427 RepID=UPI0028D89E28|nr:glycosyltransferase family 2 protein [uncultured Streptococcus sp.]
MTELISIIVPIYNVEEYLKDCLDSIQKQTYQNYDCIMINDGSTDSSREIAETYLVDSRFRLINQDNQGLSAARNTGLRNLKEESSFVAFVDSDDYLNPLFLEKLAEQISEDVDIIEGSIQSFKEGIYYNLLQIHQDKLVLTTVEEKLEQLWSQGLRGSVFPKLYRKSLLNDNFFPKGFIFEDLAVIPELVTLSKKWVKIQDVLYYYRIRENSITTKSFSEKNLDIFKIIEKFDLFFVDADLNVKLWAERLKYAQLNHQYQTTVLEDNPYASKYQEKLEKLMLQIKKYEKREVTGELISIIISVSNTGSYLRQCLDSLLNQTYISFEVILLNNGSTDSSASICQEYAEKDSRFKYFETEQDSISSSYNLGLEASKGSYITFIKSDDWVDSDYLELLYATMIEEKADIVVSTYKTFNVDTGLLEYHAYQKDCTESIFNKKDLLLALPRLDRDSSFSYVFGKLVSRIALGKIRFNESTQLGEDMEFWYKLYLLSEKVVYLNRDTYTLRKYSDVQNYLNPAIVCSDIQQRLQFISILAAKHIDVKDYIENLILLLNYRIGFLEGNSSTSKEMRWLKETLFLLGGE